MARKKNAAAAAESETTEAPVIYEKEIDVVAPATLRRSPFQDREIDPTQPEEVELAASIRRFGVMDRILVRRCADGADEIIGGHRRQAAALRAGVELVPIERWIGVPDDEAAEMVIVSNAQRRDAHPLDDCDSFARLRRLFGRTPEQIASKIHRPASYIYQRLQLEHLTEDSRKAFREGAFGFGVALELARVRDQRAQAKALKELVAWRETNGEEMTVLRARNVVRDRYMLRLSQAPFDVRAADLVPGVSACGACPKNSQNQRLLFPDGDAFSADAMCTDAGCFTSKRDATWQEAVAHAEARGVRVATAEEMKKVFTYGTYMAAGYIDLDAKEETGGRLWRVVLGKDRLRELDVMLVRDESWAAREVVTRAEALGVVRKAPKPKDPKELATASKAHPKPDTTWTDPKEIEKRRIAAEIDEEVTARRVKAVRAKVEGGPVPIEAWRVLANGLVRDAIDLGGGDVLEAIATDHGLTMSDEDIDSAHVLWRHIQAAEIREVGAIIFEIAAGGYLAQDMGSDDQAISSALEQAFGIEHKELLREGRDVVRAREREKKKAAKASTKKPRKSERDDDAEAEQSGPIDEDAVVDDGDDEISF